MVIGFAAFLITAVHPDIAPAKHCAKMALAPVGATFRRHGGRRAAF